MTVVMRIFPMVAAVGKNVEQDHARYAPSGRGTYDCLELRRVIGVFAPFLALIDVSMW